MYPRQNPDTEKKIKYTNWLAQDSWSTKYHHIKIYHLKVSKQRKTHPWLWQLTVHEWLYAVCLRWASPAFRSFTLLGAALILAHKYWPFKFLSHKSESRSVMFNSLRPCGLYSPWNSPGQNTGVGSFSLLQGTFPTQGSKPGLLHCRQIL